METHNIFSSLAESESEIFENIIFNDKFKLERIISSGQSTPPGEWYDQENNEWVILLSGSAVLVFEDDNKEYVLKPGDYILIPAHKKHRVKMTDPENKTVWLGLHYK